MGAGFKDNLLIISERPIDIDRKPIEGAEGRHCAHLTVREKPYEFLFRGEPHVAGHENLPEAMEIHFPGCLQHRRDELPVHLHNDHLGHLRFSGMERPGDRSGTEGLFVWQHIVMNVLAVEMAFECG